MPLTASGTSAIGALATSPAEKDPYRYQRGFGNRFLSEAIPGTLPYAQHMPQRNKYDLYTEGMTGSSFVAPRAENLSAWLYRIRPSVAHQGFTRLPDNPDLESCFLPLNSKVHVSPTQLAWHPFDLPPDSSKVDFVDGLKTLCGNGDPTLREGLAIHMYLANTSMDNKAFCNNDGDMLILPQQGRLDVQTEFGKLMVRSGELLVIQRGMKFKVLLPDGPSRGYIQEIFGSHYELPELGPLGGHGLANARDFESPVASFDIDQSPWQIVYKVCGQLHLCKQEHTPFDVVAWEAKLYGITSLQAFLYYKDSQQDGLYFRLLIAFLWLLDSLHTIFVTHGSYHYLVVEYMNPAALSSPTWSIMSLVIMTCISDSIVRCIFARRVWRLSRRNNYLLLVIAVASVFVFMTGIGFVLSGFALGSFQKLIRYSWLLYCALSASVLADALIAGSLCISLQQSRSGFKATDSLVNILVLYSINTGLLTSICATACFITFSIWPNQFVYMGIYFTLSKLYVNSLLAMLNSRTALRERNSGVNTIPLSPSAIEPITMGFLTRGDDEAPITPRATQDVCVRESG